MNPWLISAVAGLVFAGGKASKDVGQGAESASNAALKLALGLGIGFVVLKKAEVI